MNGSPSKPETSEYIAQHSTVRHRGCNTLSGQETMRYKSRPRLLNYFFVFFPFLHFLRTNVFIIIIIIIIITPRAQRS